MFGDICWRKDIYENIHIVGTNLVSEAADVRQPAGVTVRPRPALTLRAQGRGMSPNISVLNGDNEKILLGCEMLVHSTWIKCEPWEYYMNTP